MVSRLRQRQGLGKLLVNHVIALLQPLAEMVVTTFGPDDSDGQPTRRFHSKLGFAPAEIVYHDYRGEMLPYQVYRRAFP